MNPNFVAKTLDVEIELQDDMLGTIPGDKEIFKNFVASKCETGINDDELESHPDVDEEVAKTTTFFHRDKDNKPFIYGYMLEGFFKAAAQACRRMDNTLTKNLKAYKKVITQVMSQKLCVDFKFPLLSRILSISLFYLSHILVQGI